jgi:hypothetical protein
MRPFDKITTILKTPRRRNVVSNDRPGQVTSRHTDDAAAGLFAVDGIIGSSVSRET